MPATIATPLPEARRPARVVSPALSRIRAAMPPRGTARYRVVRHLRSGGMGDVFVAEDRRAPGSNLAYKVLRRALFNGPDREVYLRQFHREATRSAWLPFRGVVPVLDLVTDDDGRPASLMPLLDGESLDQQIRNAHREGPTTATLQALLRRLVDVARIVRRAHERGIIHADLKPGNILVDARGTTWLLDWGSAFEVGVDSAEDWVGLGTPGYFDPGTLGLAPTFTRDLHGLGAILAAILAGDPRADLRHAPRPLRAIVARTTTPGSRGVASAAAFARDLGRALAGLSRTSGALSTPAR